MQNLIQKIIVIALIVGLSACGSQHFKRNDAKQRAVASADFSKLNIVDDFMALNLMNTQIAADADATEIDEVDAVAEEAVQNNTAVVASTTDTLDVPERDTASSEILEPQSYIYVQIIAAVQSESVTQALLFAQNFGLPSLKIEQQQFKKILIGPLIDATQAEQVLAQAKQGYADAFIVIASEPLIPN